MRMDTVMKMVMTSMTVGPDNIKNIARIANAVQVTI